ncbi:hypothetical protein AA103196_2175 [Ameyamaea chiangmaiensis NBRC 103196]|uniref:Uncharacterized protein n=1 Tax=Ameyamaea chiangmaiensis TaxID=442969 RepID=A0A850PGG1_9PROT|nr:hypothetical protein [Ameyamaea chiangmaiensis]MBS4075566.1 hypothetical protein [Ameyamaea chiangmaiensis]NVN40251.1 hypothetical protein [Ameyamaea chiangmaiensis]GBQ69300.1 hypothetical protein AA103196_2175 [Ameyamaea chiangmaiensis NBRC 103196]
MTDPAPATSVAPPFDTLMAAVATDTEAYSLRFHADFRRLSGLAAWGDGDARNARYGAVNRDFLGSYEAGVLAGTPPPSDFTDCAPARRGRLPDRPASANRSTRDMFDDDGLDTRVPDLRLKGASGPSCAARSTSSSVVVE